MCLDVEDDLTVLREGYPTARKEHRCQECGRTIEPGEHYRYWVLIDHMSGGDFDVQKMCAHCWATIELGAAITDCPKNWYWGLVHDLNPGGGGFVGDILANHDLTLGEKRQMVRCVRGRRRRWRDKHGALLPVPPVPAPSHLEAAS